MWQKTRMAAACVLVLAACGGAGQDASAPAATAVQAPGPKVGAGLVLAEPAAVENTARIALSWTAPLEMTDFSVWLAVDGSSEFAPIGTHFPVGTRTAQVDRGVAWKLDFPTARIRVRGCDISGQCTDSNEQPLLTALRGSIVTVAKDSTVPVEDPLDPGESRSKARLSTDGNTLVMLRGSGDLNQFWAYHRTPAGSWQPEATLDLRNVAGLESGSSLRLSGDGNTAVLTHSRLPNSVVVLVRDPLRRWSQQAVVTLDRPASPNGDAANISISEDGNTLAVNDGSSRVAVLTRNDAGHWSQESVVAEPAGSLTPLRPFDGLALSPNGRLLAVTSFGGDIPDCPEGNYFATVRVYQRDATRPLWTEQANLRSDRPYSPAPYFPPKYGRTDLFGNGGLAFDASGTRLVIGAPRAPAPSYEIDVWGPVPGAVYVFDATQSGWQKSARITNIDRPLDDYFGEELSLSRDGKVLASSACGFFSAAAANHNHPQAWDFSPANNDVPQTESPCNHHAAAYLYTADEQGTWAFETSVIPNDQNLQDPTEIDNTFRYNMEISGDGKTFLFNWRQTTVPPAGSDRRIIGGGVAIY